MAVDRLSLTFGALADPTRVERYRVMWEQRLDRLDDYLKELQQREKKNGRKRRG